MSLTVVKYGGSLLDDEAHQSVFLPRLARLAQRERVVLVHGGGREITKAMEAAGLAAKFVDGRRYTDASAMAVVELTLFRINARLVTALRREGVSAEGFSGRAAHLMRARAIPELGRVGEPESIQPQALTALLERPALAVFYPVAEDDHGQPLNVNADDFALALAAAARAERLVFLTDTGGILDKGGRTIASVEPQEAERLIADQTITGGMALKVRSCVEALRRGVGRVDIIKDLSSLADGKANSDGTSILLNT